MVSQARVAQFGVIAIFVVFGGCITILGLRAAEQERFPAPIAPRLTVEVSANRPTTALRAAPKPVHSAAMAKASG